MIQLLLEIRLPNVYLIFGSWVMENLLIHALKEVGICPAGFVVINKLKIPTS